MAFLQLKGIEKHFGEVRTITSAATASLSISTPSQSQISTFNPWPTTPSPAAVI